MAKLTIDHLICDPLSNGGLELSIGLSNGGMIYFRLREGEPLEEAYLAFRNASFHIGAVCNSVADHEAE